MWRPERVGSASFPGLPHHPVFYCKWSKPGWLRMPRKEARTKENNRKRWCLTLFCIKTHHWSGQTLEVWLQRWRKRGGRQVWNEETNGGRRRLSKRETELKSGLIEVQVWSHYIIWLVTRSCQTALVLHGSQATLQSRNETVWKIIQCLAYRQFREGVV